MAQVLIEHPNVSTSPPAKYGLEPGVGGVAIHGCVGSTPEQIENLVAFNLCRDPPAGRGEVGMQALLEVAAFGLGQGSFFVALPRVPRL